jgi:UPF0271 protein
MHLRKPCIDLNCDMGESYGTWQMGQDAQVLRHVTSANIACGMHAGDPLTMQRTVAAAVAQGVAIGAHPSLPDLQGFGRRVMAITANEAYALTLYQIGALSAFAQAAGSRLHHVKPHGALYNMAARDATLAQAIAQAVHDADAALILVGLAGSALPAAGVARGLKVAHEVFADRHYEADGSLTSRSEKDAVIHDIDVAITQALTLVNQGNVTTHDGKILSLQADTICLHGDRTDAAMFAERLRAALDQAGVEVRAQGRAIA